MGHVVPLVGDFHYNGHRLLADYPDMARALAKFRINPGNVGFGEKRDRQFELMVETALRFARPVRIGVNWGSLDQDLATRLMDLNAQSHRPQPADFVLREALVRSALDSAAYAERLGLDADRIVISAKVSRVQDVVAVYRELARRSLCAPCRPDRGGHGDQGDRGHGRRACPTAAGRHRRHDPRLADPAPDEPHQQRGRGLPGGAERWACAPSPHRSPPARDAAGPPALCSRNSPTASRSGCASRCRSGSAALSGCREHERRGDGLHRQWPGRASMPTSASACPAPARPTAPVFVDGKKAHTLRGEQIAEDFQAIVADYVKRRYGKVAVDA